MDRDRRRYLRVAYKLPVVLKERGGGMELLSADISHKGAFLITDSPKPERQLVQLSFALPGASHVQVMAMVARNVPRAAEDVRVETPVGMGINFFAVSDGDRKQWEQFIHRAIEDGAEVVAETQSSQALPVRRQHPRFVSRFLVQLRDRDRLREFFTRDISAGGMFLRTPAPEKVNPLVALIIVHPESREEFSIEGTVMRTVLDRPVSERGVAIRFEQLTPTRQAQLAAFIETGVHALDRLSGARDERVRSLCAVASLVSESAAALASLGNALFAEEEPELAINFYRRSLDCDATCISAHRGLYKAHLSLGDGRRAQAALAAIRRLEQRPQS